MANSALYVAPPRKSPPRGSLFRREILTSGGGGERKEKGGEKRVGIKECVRIVERDGESRTKLSFEDTTSFHSKDERKESSKTRRERGTERPYIPIIMRH